jgi:predicted transposase YbfD/YdcC
MHTGGSIIEHFSIITDPRVDRNKDHQLTDIMMIAICAVICGADGWADIEQFGNETYEWFETFLELPNGIPSHDTFGRVFAMIDAAEFEQAFVSWVRTIAQLTTGDIVAIDGKTNRRSHDRKIGKDAIHLVSAFASRNGITLGQRAIDTKSNEMKAIPKLLEILNISGCIVTIDAAGCYSNVIDMIVKRKADYVIAVKQNQPTLYSDIEQLFEREQNSDLAYACTEKKSHGREEKRECWVINTKPELDQIQHTEKWKNLASVARIINTRIVGGKATTENRWYISSLSSGDAAQLLSAVRQHWAIENTLHWTLDVTFREDDSRIRIKNAQQNFSLLRKLALNLIKQDTETKGSVRMRRKKAGWSQEYLLKLLNI